MKTKMIFAVLFVVFFISCSHGYKKEKKIQQKINETVVDSCQYNQFGRILYFLEDSSIVEISYWNLIVGNDTLSMYDEISKEIRDTLKEKCSEPESYASVSFRHFKKMIETTSLDSCSDKGWVDEFYLGLYKISIIVEESIPFESKGEIIITTKDIFGEYLLEFCSDASKWSYEQRQEIFVMLTEKKKELKPQNVPEPIYQSSGIVETDDWWKVYKERVKDSIIQGVYDNWNETHWDINLKNKKCWFWSAFYLL